MTLEEFVRLSPKQIRSDERLMQLYVKYHEAAFSFKPKCTGCSFKRGFEKLRRYSTKGEKIITKFETMEAKTFKLKKKYWNKILTFKKNGITHRKYGNNIDEDFARELVASGQEDLFDVLPKEEKTIDVNSEIDYYKSLDHRTELLPIYNETKQRTGQKAKSNKKVDIIDFIIENTVIENED